MSSRARARVCLCQASVRGRGRASVCAYQGFPGGGKKTSPQHKGRAERPCPPLAALAMHRDNIFFAFVEELGSVLTVEHKCTQRTNVVVAHRVLLHLRVQSSRVIISVTTLLLRLATIDHAKGAIVVICKKLGHVADIIAIENSCRSPAMAIQSVGLAVSKTVCRREWRGQQGERTP